MNTTINSRKAIPALVCGIVSVVVPYLGFGPAILGIVFGIIAKNEIRRSEGKLEGGGMATAGLVCGIAGLVFGIIWIIAFSMIGLAFRSIAPFLDTI